MIKSIPVETMAVREAFEKIQRIKGKYFKSP